VNLCNRCRAQVVSWLIAEKSRIDDELIELCENQHKLHMVSVTGTELDGLLDSINEDIKTLRVMLVPDGVKFKIDSGVWSPALGSTDG